MTLNQAIYILRNTAWLGSNKDREQMEEAVEMAVEALNKMHELPPAQPKIIYCKDCKYSKSFDDGGIWCDRLTGTFKVESGGYCKWGKT